MDCHDARLLLTLQRREPEQLDAVELEALEAHVELCPGCQTWLQSEARFESALASAIKNVTAPAGLKDKISARLAASRPFPVRRWAMAAAAILLLVGAGGGIVLLQPEPIDPATVPVLYQDGVSPQEVQDYFASLGYTMTPPPDFSYELLRRYKPVKFQGHIVPRLTFQYRLDNGNVVTADVYCLSPRQFSYDNRELPSQSAGQKYEVLRGDHQLYFVDCIGGDIDVFRRRTF